MRLILLGRGVGEALEQASRAQLDQNVLAGPRPGDKLVDERVRIGTEPPGSPLPGGPFRRAADTILAYRVFPEWLVTGVVSRTPLREGDTFGNLVHLLPGVGVFFAGRVKEVIEEPWRAGFTLQTVKGHPATGEETFAVKKDAPTGEVFAHITSWSRAGSWLMWLGLPVFRWVQMRAVRGALKVLAAAATR
jgi:uncharacterized protein (UPF0548 family)